MPKTARQRLQEKIAKKKAAAEAASASEAASGVATQDQRVRSQEEVQLMIAERLKQLEVMKAAQESQSSAGGGIIINAGTVVMDGQLSGSNVQIVSDDLRVGKGAKFDSDKVSIRTSKFENKSKIKAGRLEVVADEISGPGEMLAREAGIVSAYSIRGKQKFTGKVIYGGAAAEKLRSFLESTPEDITEIQKINANRYTDFLAYEYNKNTKKANQCISKMEKSLSESKMKKSLSESDDQMITKFIDDAYNIRFLNLVDARKYSDAGHILEKMDIAQRAIYEPILESIIEAEEKKKSSKKKKAKEVQAQDIRDLTSEEIAKREEGLQKKREEEAEAARKRFEELESWRAKVKAEKEFKKALELELSMQAEAETQERMSQVKESKAKSKAAREAAKENFPDNIGSFVIAVENGEIGLKNLPPMLSQSYFCYKRQEIENKNPLSVLSTSIEWKIEGKEVYRYAPDFKVSNVYKINDIPNYYAAISEDLGEVNTEFKVALEHGRLSKGGSAAKSHSTSGLKVFDNVIELKIKGASGDTRLYTDTIYDDGNGNKLVLLDRFGKHSELERFHKAGASTKLIKLLSYQAQESGARAAAAEPVDYAQEFYLKALAGLSGFDFGSEM